MILPRPAPVSPADALDAAAAVDPRDRSAEHLAGFAFRFGPPTPAPAFSAVPRPAPGTEWTLAQTLQEVRLERASLVETSRGVRLRHPGRASPDLGRAVARFAGPLRDWVRLGVGAGRVSSAWHAPGWDEATRLYAAWFGHVFAPAGPIQLRPGVRVTDAARFRASVAARLAAGPSAPGAAGLADDLASLYARFGCKAERTVLPAPHPRLAA